MTCETDNYLFYIENLTVIITQEGDSWIAQGVQINYFAYGDSVKDAQKSFETGLYETVKAHLERFGSIIHMLEYAPDRILNKYYEEPQKFSFNQIGFVSVKEGALPVRNLRFVEPEYKQAA